MTRLQIRAHILMTMLLTFLLPLSSSGQVALAAEVIGVEPVPEKTPRGRDSSRRQARNPEPPVDDSGLVDEIAPEDAEPAPRTRRGDSGAGMRDEDSDESGDLIKDVGVSGSVGVGSGFSGSLTISLGLSRYTAINIAGFYESLEDGDRLDRSWGPELDFVLRFPNPTVVTPFVGTGIGFVRWIREVADAPWDDSGSALGSVFGGLNIAFTRHFGLQISQRRSTWVSDPPRKFSDRSKFEDRSFTRTGLGFVVGF